MNSYAAVDQKCRRSCRECRQRLGYQASEQALKPREKRVPVSITDLSIMDALADDPKVPFGTILKATGLSPKTVCTHLGLLQETRAISIDSLLGPVTDSGELEYPLVIAGSAGTGQIRRTMGEAAQITILLSRR
jgi:hypothetical protein